jgi:hypothetical protein
MSSSSGHIQLEYKEKSRIIIIMIIRYGAKSISLQTLFVRLNDCTRMYAHRHEHIYIK